MVQRLRALGLAEDPGDSHLHGGSELSVTPVPGDLTPSSDLNRH